ncbi:MAG: response regulator [Methylococcales bacterium]|nr:response regulator [Methylococcales bacterium]
MNRNLKLKSLRITLLMILMLFFLIMLIALSLTEAYIGLDKKRQEISVLNQQIGVITAASAEKALWDFDEITASHLVEGILKLDEVTSVSILDKDWQIFKEAKKKTSTSTTPQFSFFKENLHFIYPLNSPDSFVISLDKSNKDYDIQPIGYLEVYLDHQIIWDSYLYEGGKQVFTLVALMIFLLFVIERTFSYLVTSPLVRLSNNVLKINFDNNELYEIPVEGFHSKNELGLLTNRFNSMVKQLQHSHEQLLKSHHQLEQRVDDRTKDLEVAKNSAEKLQKAAEAASGAKSRFLASMSHELRTPLTSIIGLAELMENHPKLNSKESSYIQTINESSNVLLTLINDILDIAKIEAKQITIESNDVNLDDFLRSIIAMFSIRAKKKGLILNSTSNDLPDYIQVDNLKLRQVLVNLLDNAIKYSEKGKITLNLNFDVQGDHKGFLYFDVIDQGIGISDSELELLFKPFSQTHSGRKTGSGTGLGLFISKHFVELMGGEILATSQIHSGSIFSFFIPIIYTKRHEILTVEQQIVEIKLKQGQSPPTILIVEDKEAIRMMLEAHLERVGFRVEIACNGRESIEQFKLIQPDLILMDYLMPIMNGSTATRAIRQMPSGELVKIIMLTASISEESMKKHTTYNYDAIVYKPLKIVNLLEIIGKNLDVQFTYQDIIDNDRLG